MVSALQSGLQDRVSDYLIGHISLPDLENWLWPFMDDLGEDAESDVRGVAGAIGSLISEFSYGHRTEESMVREMASAVRASKKTRNL